MPTPIAVSGGSQDGGQGAPQGGQPVQSFAERKAEQLRQERVVSGEMVRDEIPGQDEGPTGGNPQGTPLDEGWESAEDLSQDSQGGQAGDDTEGMLAEGDDSASQDEIPEGDPQADDGGDTNWEQRYNDLRAEFDRGNANRQQIETEHAEAMGETLRYRFHLEDQLTEVEQRAQFYADVMSGNASRFENINWAQVPPDQVTELQQQMQQAMMLKQQAEAAFADVKANNKATRDDIRRREAEIAQVRLRRTIGFNQEVYQNLREFAVQSGMSRDSFNELTDPVVMEWAYTAMQNKRAAGSIQRKTRKTKKAPVSGQGRRQPRDSRGKYARTHLEPNQKGSFADKHRHRLAMERGR